MSAPQDRQRATEDVSLRWMLHDFVMWATVFVLGAAMGYLFAARPWEPAPSQWLGHKMMSFTVRHAAESAIERECHCGLYWFCNDARCP